MRDDYLYSDLDFRADFSSGQQIYGLTMAPSPPDSLSFSSSTGSTITKNCYDDLNNFAGIKNSRLDMMKFVDLFLGSLVLKAQTLSWVLAELIWKFYPIYLKPSMKKF